MAHGVRQTIYLFLLAVGLAWAAEPVSADIDDRYVPLPGISPSVPVMFDDEVILFGEDYNFLWRDGGEVRRIDAEHADGRWRQEAFVWGNQTCDAHPWRGAMMCLIDGTLTEVEERITQLSSEQIGPFRFYRGTRPDASARFVWTEGATILIDNRPILPVGTLSDGRILVLEPRGLSWIRPDDIREHGWDPVNYNILLSKAMWADSLPRPDLFVALLKPPPPAFIAGDDEDEPRGYLIDIANNEKIIFADDFSYRSGVSLSANGEMLYYVSFTGEIQASRLDGSPVRQALQTPAGRVTDLIPSMAGTFWLAGTSTGMYKGSPETGWERISNVVTSSPGTLRLLTKRFPGTSYLLFPNSPSQEPVDIRPAQLRRTVRRIYLEPPTTYIGQVINLETGAISTLFDDYLPGMIRTMDHGLLFALPSNPDATEFNTGMYVTSSGRVVSFLANMGISLVSVDPNARRLAALNAGAGRGYYLNVISWDEASLSRLESSLRARQ